MPPSSGRDRIILTKPLAFGDHAETTVAVRLALGESRLGPGAKIWLGSAETMSSTLMPPRSYQESTSSTVMRHPSMCGRLP